MKSSIIGSYDLAIKYMEEGYITEALNVINDSLEKGEVDISLIQLRALINYRTCRFESALEDWKSAAYLLSEDFNINKYIKEDVFCEIVTKYNRGNELFSEEKYAQAIGEFKYILSIDKALIEPYELMALCSYSIEEYKDARYYCNKALSLHKDNKKMLQFKKTLGLKGIKKLKLLYVTIIVFLITSCSLIFYKSNNNKNKLQVKINNLNNEVSRKDDKNKALQDKLTKAEIQKKELEKSKTNKDFKEESVPKNKEENETDKNSKKLAREVDKKEKNSEKTIDIKNLNYDEEFSKAYDLFLNGKYEDAISTMDIIYKYSNVDYLIAESTYFIGRSYEHLNKRSESIKYYTEYVNKFMDRNYYEDSVYRLCILLYENNNLNESKKYANILKNLNSFYYNTKVKEILNEQ